MNSDVSIKLALEHSRALFIYHAGQRIASLNFYFVAIALFLTGFGLVAKSEELAPGYRAFIGVALSIAGVLLSKYLQALDRRNEQLLKCDESLLIYAEQTMANMNKCEQSEWQITASTDKVEPLDVRYSKIVPKIFRLYKILSVVGGVYSILPLAKAALLP
jgi:hypothetical protein